MKKTKKVLTASAVCVSLFASYSAYAAEPESGLVINSSNVGDYSQYLLPGSVELVKRGAELKVQAKSPREKLSNRVWMDATEANRGKARIDDLGTVSTEDGGPWIGGTPFPDASTAVEVMANYQYTNVGLEGDDWTSVDGSHAAFSRFFYINNKGKIYKDVAVGGAEYHMNGRLNLDPRPFVPGKEQEDRRRIFVFLSPFDVKGIVTLDIQYRDQSKLPDSYIYLPNFRRVRRVSTANRADAVAGSEYSVSDLSGFSDPLGLWKFKILEKKKMLMSVTDAPLVPRKGDPGFINGYFVPNRPVELREAYVIEATPRYDTVYSRKVLTIDAEVFRISDADFYDKQNQLYKVVQQYFSNDEDGSVHPAWNLILNLQTGFATMLAQFGVSQNMDVSERILEVNNLKDLSR